MMRRPSRPEIRALIERGRPVRHVDNSYAGFSVRRKLTDALVRSDPSASQGVDRLELAYAPYGGLAVPVTGLARAGLPRSDYHLYADDHEFTTRLIRAGYPIRLHPTAHLADVDTSWSGTSRTMIASVDPRVDERRAYYAVRNRRHFEGLWLRQFPVEVACNAVAYWLIVVVDCIALIARGESPRRIATRVGTIRRATRDGKSGRLGERLLDGQV